MIEIIAILVVLALIGYLVEWLKDHLHLVGGIIVLLALSGIILAIGEVLLPVVIDNFPVVLICSVILIVAYSTVTKKQRRSYLDWIEQVGFGKESDAPGSERIWKWAKKKEYSEDAGSGYVVSVIFCQNLMHDFVLMQAVTADVFEGLCIQSAPMFSPADILVFLDCLRRQDILTPLEEQGEETVYVANFVISNCEHLFEIQGGTTEKEFLQVCKTEMSSVPVNYTALARFVLENMVLQGAASTVPIAGHADGEVLYVAKRKLANSKMKRVEISLDD